MHKFGYFCDFLVQFYGFGGHRLFCMFMHVGCFQSQLRMSMLHAKIITLCAGHMITISAIENIEFVCSQSLGSRLLLNCQYLGLILVA